MLRTTALTSTLVLASLLAAPSGEAADECGPLAASITCTASGSPFANGITYNPVADFTLSVQDLTVINTTGSGADGISITKPGAPVGNIIVNSAGDNINADGSGISVYNDIGSTTITNSATIAANDFGIIAVTQGSNSDIVITNTSNVIAVVSASGPFENAISAFTYGAGSDITIVNSGSVDASADATANALSGFTYGGNIAITNTGDLQAGRLGIAGTTVGNANGVAITNSGAIEAGVHGIAARTYGSGSAIAVINSGDITAGENGMFLRSYGAGSDIDSDINVTNSQTITAGADGIRALSYGGGSDITIANRGAINAGTDGIYAITNGVSANLTINNSAGINATNVGIQTYTLADSSSLFINNSGDVVSGVAGVQGYTGGAFSDVTIINSGDITVTSGIERALGGQGAGAFSNVTIENDGTLNSAAFGIDSVTYGGGNVTIANSGDIVAGLRGINARALDVGGIVDITNTGDINAGTEGIRGRTEGDGNGVFITNSGAISAAENGIFSQTAGANAIVQIINSGDIIAGTNGIFSKTYGTASDITVSNDARIQAGNFGIIAEVAGSGNIVVTTAQSSVIESFDAGIFSRNNNGNISIVNSGSVTTTISDYYAGAIEARSSGANNNITITNASTGVITAEGSAGIYAENTANGATINITNNGTVSSFGYYAGGIIAFVGNGTAIVNNSGLVTTTNDFAQGIVGFTQGGNVDLSNSGTVITSGYGSAGIFGRPDIGFDGTIIVENTGTIITSGASAYGIETKGSGGGSQNITNSGSILTSGDNANAIDARSRLFETSSANIFIINAGQGELTSGRANGIYAAAANGTIAVANSGSINAFTNGILAIADNNSVTIENSGLIVTTGPDGAGIAVTSATGSVINNLAGGVISPNSGSLLAIDAKGAAVAVNNAGIIIGKVDLTGNSDVFANLTSGAFEARLTSDFGGGNDAFNNNGTVHTASNAAVGEATAFINLENFNNSGLVSLIDGGTGDSFTLSGNFNAGSGTLGLDAFLGGPGSPADLFIVGGNVTGQTAVVINNTNPNNGVFNEVGITVITVNGTVDESAFALQNGPIEAGFFSYDLFFEPAPGNNSFELRSFVDADGHLLPQLLTATQDIWHITSDAWFDRTADLRVLLRGDGPVSFKDPSAPSALTPAIWARGSGEWLTRDAAASTTAFGRTYDFNLDRDLRVGDFQAGIDFGTRGVVERGDALIFGLTGGAIVANLDYKNVGREFDLTGGQIGAYATYLNHNVFIDALLKADFLEIDAESGPLTDTLDATTVGIRVDAGYRFGGKGLFFEPLATLAVSWSDIDSFTSDGNKVEFSDDASVRGRLGFRLGTTMTPWAGVRLEPFVIGSLWSQLEGGNSADLTSTGTTFTLTDDHIDVWGEISAGLNVFDDGNSTSAFTKVDVTFGDDIQGIGGQVGMRIKW